MEMCLDVNSDFISNLPEEVIDQILVRLPIKDAVRTSVLSTKWRYKWTTITQLVFSDRLIHFIDRVLLLHNNNMDKLIHFIDRVLLLHTGCFIHKFELSFGYLQNFSTIDCWILFLSRKNIKELVLKFSYWGDKKYKLPSCFFSAQQISTLELQGCVLMKPPPTFTGFSKLKILYLHRTTFVDECGFECLISKCPVLERLTWDTLFIDLGHVNICSPNLKYLFLRGSFDGICFENTPLLSDVSIVLNMNVRDEKKLINEFLQSETGHVVKILNSLPNLRKFVVGRSFLKFLAVGKIPEKLPFTCHHLNNLTLRLNFECVNQICVTLCLLNSSPNLRELKIISRNPLSKPNLDIENFWEKRTHIDWKMSGLQIVKITNIKGFELELELKFIKLILANSPMLEMLSISKQDILNPKRLEFLKEKLCAFPRASAKAEIEFLQEQDEE